MRNKYIPAVEAKGSSAPERVANPSALRFPQYFE
jgi:hypothetical protein